MPSVVPIILRRMRMPLVVLIVAYSIATVGFTLIPGVDDQGNPWRMSFFEAFYVVSYTGSTIGFGEVPYDFSGGQRMWTMVSIYLTVFSWLYSVGTIISLLQDKSFRQELNRVQLQRSLNRFREPFYVICGYGDTGKLLTRSLLSRGMRVVVVDRDPEAIDALRVKDQGLYVPGFTLDAEIPGNLVKAGLQHPLCRGVLAVTDNNHTNLKIATTVKLLNKHSKVFCRAGSEENANNMLSFGTDLVVNPNQDFARRLLLGIRQPDTHRVYDWLTSLPGAALPERPMPPRGRWILCGFGPFGRAVYEALSQEPGIDMVVVTPHLQQPGVPAGSVEGKGTEAVTLREAGIDQAVAIVAATPDDADNLSIMMTARELNSGIYMVAQQNRLHNRLLFRAINPELPVQTSFLVASRFLSVLNAPLLKEFLQEAEVQGNDWNGELLQRMASITDTITPESWHVQIGDEQTPAVTLALRLEEPVSLGNLCRSPRHRRQCLDVVPLMLRRNGRNMLLPDEKEVLEPGDRVLFCGTSKAQTQMQWSLRHLNALRYVQTGNQRPDGLIWRWLARRRAAPADVRES
ncbi:MAG: NAD-binding protein [Pseudomonadota bacterium]|nr:NAD-binding protein [Pseudomonadota bacterium]